LQVLFRGQRPTGQRDLEAIEMATRAALHRAGAAVLSGLLEAPAPAEPHRPCSCGQPASYQEMRPKRILTVLGAIEVWRPYYLCPYCHGGHSPQDAELDVEGTGCSPGVRRMLALVGSQSSFDSGRQQLELLAGLTVTTKAVERHAEVIGADIAARQQIEMKRAFERPWPRGEGAEIPVLYVQMDGTGVPVVATEVEGRAGQVEGEPAHTREAKLGCVFTQTQWDAERRPVRDEASTTYTGAIETAQEFGRRLYTETQQRGWNRARQRVVMGDGAPWIWNLTDEHFPDALQIVDLYHARQHLWNLAAQLFPSPSAPRQARTRRLQSKLDRGQIKSLVAALRSTPPPRPELAHLLQTEADYFQRNAHRMRYPAFRQQGLFIGSGVIEAGCKTVIASRLKQSGMFWTLRGANAIIALRCNRLSRKFEDYWANRTRAA
jgi:hypothetical protein